MMQSPPIPTHLQKNECALSLRTIENLDQSQKSEGTGCHSSYRWDVLVAVQNPGGRNVESGNCRSNCAPRLHFVCNSRHASPLARGKGIAVHGECLRGGCGCQSQSTSARLPARPLRIRGILPSEWL